MNEPSSSACTVPPGPPEFLWTSESSEPSPAAPTSTHAAPLPPWANLPVAPASLSADRRFAALSTLPESLRLPPKRDVPPARHQRVPAPPTPETEMAPPATEAPGPVMLPDPAARQLGFNCPACFAVLVIKEPATYDGRPAPCPTCGNRILPPQCVPESPFSIVHRVPDQAGTDPRLGY